jgi:lactate dehydrogenase-like 2-hydroxyacid dehydrogenase
MKAVAYSIRSFEKEFLAKANQKKHDITLISNTLGPDTAGYAAGKDAVIVFTNDDVSAQVIEQLAVLGIKFIVTRSAGTEHIDKVAAANFGIKIANVPANPLYDINNESTHDSFQEIANKTIRTLDLWQQNKCVGDACACSKNCRTANPIDNKTIL